MASGDFAGAFPFRVVPARMLGEGMPPPAQRLHSCNCKNSKCLKLYCECFASGRFCRADSCRCTSCNNNADSDDTRRVAIMATLDRNPNAFRPKISANRAGWADDGKRKRGCHCKRSGCLKKYCECFQADIYCTPSCKCSNCKNFAGCPERQTIAQAAVVSGARGADVKTEPQHNRHGSPLKGSPAKGGSPMKMKSRSNRNSPIKRPRAGGLPHRRVEMGTGGADSGESALRGRPFAAAGGAGEVAGPIQQQQQLLHLQQQHHHRHHYQQQQQQQQQRQQQQQQRVGLVQQQQPPQQPPSKQQLLQQQQDTFAHAAPKVDKVSEIFSPALIEIFCRRLLETSKGVQARSAAAEPAAAATGIAADGTATVAVAGPTGAAEAPPAGAPVPTMVDAKAVLAQHTPKPKLRAATGAAADASAAAPGTGTSPGEAQLLCAEEVEEDAARPDEVAGRALADVSAGLDVGLGAAFSSMAVDLRRLGGAHRVYSAVEAAVLSEMHALLNEAVTLSEASAQDADAAAAAAAAASSAAAAANAAGGTNTAAAAAAAPPHKRGR